MIISKTVCTIIINIKRPSRQQLYIAYNSNENYRYIAKDKWQYNSFDSAGVLNYGNITQALKMLVFFFFF